MAEQAPPGFQNAILALVALNRNGQIRDFALIGAVGAAVYAPARMTEHLDAVILVKSDEEYTEAVNSIGARSEGSDAMLVRLCGVPVQLFPTTMGPAYALALRESRFVEVGGAEVKVASPEALTVLAQQAGRPKDQARMEELAQHTDPELLARARQELGIDPRDGPHASQGASPASALAEAIYESKAALHREQAGLPLNEKLASLDRMAGFG